MTKQAPVLRRMIFAQGIDPFRVVTFGAELFRLFFLHPSEAAVILIQGKLGRGFFRGVEEKGEDPYGCNQECSIKKDDSYFFGVKGSHE